MCDFVNLHNHGVSSLLDGYSKPKEAVQRVVELGQTAFSMTEHGNFGTAIDTKLACEDAGIKWIPGIEFYIVPWGRDLDWRMESGKRRGTSYHLTCWAYNQTGYQNILRLVELSNLSGYFYAPRITYDWLETYNEGLIITSGCMASETSNALNPEYKPTNKSYQLVNKIFSWAKDVFSNDRYFIELQDHNIPELREINVELSRVNKHYDFDYIIANDSHYSYPEDWEGQVDLLCVSTRSTHLAPGKLVQMYRDNPDYYIASYEDMRQKDYGFLVPDSAFSNTLRVAEMVEEDIKVGYEPEVKKYRFPVMPEYENNYDSNLYFLARDGFVHRYENGRSHYNDLALDRFKHEIGVISRLGFSSYFLCVYDIKQFCDKENIPMTVRGSAGGSIILYCLGITNFCPLEYNLIFERFLNPDRVSAPDADLDIDPARRDEVIKYLIKKYGADKAAQVATFNYIKGRGAIRDAARILDYPPMVGDALAKKIPEGGATLSKVLDSNNDAYVSDLAEDFEEERIVETALRLEGQVRAFSVHAGAVMLSDEPLRDHYPLVRPTAKSKAVSKIVVGFDYETAESLGGIKMDILGVMALGVLYDCLESVNSRHGKKYTFDNIPIDDKAAYDLINSGMLAEIFQLSGYTAKEVTRVIKPSSVNDVMAITSLARPGPLQYVDLYSRRKNEGAKVEYAHSDLEDILVDTYGIIIYQEQAMRVSQVIAGFTGGEADIFRKAISKKRGINKVLTLFYEKAVDRGYHSDFIDDLINDLVSFGEYAFNASHACAYSLISVKMAYLKANYPLEFYSAALSRRIGDDDKFNSISSEMVQQGYKVLPPRVGLSEYDKFAIDDNYKGVRFPLSAIKNVGKTSKNLVGIELNDINRFPWPTGDKLKKAGKRALESLIMVGGFDHLGDRNYLLENINLLSKGNPIVHQVSLIDHDPKYKYTRQEYLSLERQLAGMYLSGHPLDGIELPHPPFSNTKSYEDADGKMGLFIGVLSKIKTHRQRNGRLMAFLDIEDKEYFPISIVAFNSVYEPIADRLSLGCIVKVLGKIQVNEDDKYGKFSIIANQVMV